ncbi:hypothetical protein KSS87_019275 [Heliosperma pusillum]|nr:hypothetical protein KSS87_019275 [Heliosperma pusillum]
MAKYTAMALKSLFIIMGCITSVAVIYTLVTDGLPFRKDLLSPWMTATLVDFYINVTVLAVWVCYKESSWIAAALWVILVVCFGRKDVGKRSSCQVITARIAFSVLGCLMFGVLLYTILTDGSPFRKDVITPWLTTTLIDFYINVAVLSVWIGYKESSWIMASIWIVLLICSGSIATCAYIVRHLLLLSPDDPLELVLLNSRHRQVYSFCRFFLSLYLITKKKLEFVQVSILKLPGIDQIKIIKVPWVVAKVGFPLVFIHGGFAAGYCQKELNSFSVH